MLPEHQRKGIGKSLILEGLSRLKGLNAKGCCLVGHPDYYRKLGFKNVSDVAGLAACLLWQRLYDEKNLTKVSIEMLDDWMEKGYKLLDKEKINESCCI